MAESADISVHLRDRVEARITHLGISPGELAEATGLSAPALANLRRGLVRDYSVRLKREVCRVLDWTPDSIDRLLRGQEPVVRSVDATPSGGMASPAVSDEVLALFDAVTADLAALTERVEALEGRKRRGDGRGSGAAAG